jgi:nicotinamidase-related amidase
MQKIGDKIIYNTIEEILDPSHTALVVWDVQNLNVSRIFNKEEFISNLSLIIELARKATVPIFFTRFMYYQCDLNLLQEFTFLVN